MTGSTANLFAKIAVPVPLHPIDGLLDYEVPATLTNIAPGSLVAVPFGRRTTWGLVMQTSKTTAQDPSKIKAIERALVPVPIFHTLRLQHLQWLCTHYLYPIGETVEAAIPAFVRNLKNDAFTKSLLAAQESLSSNSSTPTPQSAHVTLRPEQQSAVDAILKADHKVQLLWGITGSGKTEVYLEAISRVIENNQSAIVLVPEIALTPQLLGRFEKRFPGEVAVFHSGRRPTEARKDWIQALLGKKRIAIGARSAIFAPVQNIGLIVVDEEHDGSYKQEDRLRYNARDAALALGNLCSATVVLGSATPSAETYHAAQSGRFGLLKLPHRAIQGSELPTLQIVDLKESKPKPTHAVRGIEEAAEEIGLDALVGPSNFFLSQQLLSAIDQRLHAGEQSILFLNRRGVGSHFLCLSCGHSFECPDCDVNLTPHRSTLLCHYCGYHEPLPQECPACKKQNSCSSLGVGTAAIEDALLLHFPKTQVSRLDRDTAQNPKDLELILDRFRKQESQILVGTQMVAKGHDFPKVSLVGVLFAELGLGVPDFRATERNFQLLLQVAGRAGRALPNAQVLLQSFDPQSEILKRLVNYRGLEDYGSFLDEENRKRLDHGYPPHGRIALLRWDSMDATRAENAANTVAQALRRIANPKLQILGPVASPLSRVRNHYRFQLLLKAPQHNVLQTSLRWIQDTWYRDRLEKKLGARMIADIDPQQMM